MINLSIVANVSALQTNFATIRVYNFKKQFQRPSREEEKKSKKRWRYQRISVKIMFVSTYPIYYPCIKFVLK
jgi:hypothetical protein